MKAKAFALVLLTAALLSSGCSSATNNTGSNATTSAPPVFENVSVHDPSIIESDGTYYVFGSHLASAKSSDLMAWTQISTSVSDDNPLIPGVKEELAETFAWAETDTLWAADVIQLEDGKYYMYYNACRGDSPLSAMGVAVSDSIEGPYRDLGIMLKSGMVGEAGADGEIYDATVHPNVVDPDVFYDKDGQLWMVYGSYSGGIFILKMDSKTGFPLPDQGYGKKLLGGNHSRIEGPYMLYSPDTEYYYLFLSYGGLTADGGYNMRVARSKNPDGPFVDAEDKPMEEAMGAFGTAFDDASYAPYGAKLMGSYAFQPAEDESDGSEYGYVSPGHNSAYYDEQTKRYYLIFHARFPGLGEQHEVRVHQMFFNEDGWPVVAPYRYGGENIAEYAKADIAGEYKFVNHNKDITADIQQSTIITLAEDGAVAGSVSGTWELSDDHTATITIDGTTYKGVFLRQYDETGERQTMTFSAMSGEGITIWGSRIITP
ncbi:glycoside hydrolase family 43 protein [Paenibacillus methanolicus]|uniref:Arabinan endo-1,5-alpha-L-arabinosidase n=1 Tax=Paenibacillus methanolicus TaxID=582686 RepID=A0A5S5BXB7_9BACL|nr:glycoside hydrolase family 43 protein [Paenibacillus methanolicus]TYP70822.1 arabinan endo-1,5-alpha-L-arabinosidase [Paenibacillus methanolicus]